jgi:hypothetical protein
MTPRLRLLLGLALVVLVSSWGHAAEVRTFTSRTTAELRARFAGRPFLLAFWSVSCEPCRAELALVTRLHREFPAVPVILVAADGPQHQAAVQRFLGREDWGAIERWQFGDEAEERLRFSVDPAWRGELPRAVFHDAAHVTTVHSGVPEEGVARAWFAAAQRAAAQGTSQR